MLHYLFRRLTTDRQRGAELFDGVVARAREPAWYAAARVPDTLEGRFAVLSTVVALVLVRLEAEGAAGDKVSVALTERFIEAMEAEHREFGLGDPTLGKTVRKLVGVLARRTDLWRSAAQGETDWTIATRDSLYGADAEPSALNQSVEATRRLWVGLSHADLERIEQGNLE